jgi:HD superfamily phosphohydrolase
MIAGLIHDIGHGPFSHTFERFIKKTRPEINYNHEKMTIRIFKEMNCCEEYIRENVCKIIEGIPLDHNPFLGHIIHNTINGLDADKLDYFIRDSQCTSFAIGCDWRRIIYESCVFENEIVFPYKMVGDIFNLYQTRFRLYKEVYFHKTVCVIEDMLLDILVLTDRKTIFGYPCKLAYTVDCVDIFLLTNDDIIGQIERCGNQEIIDKLNKIKIRNFDNPLQEPRVAHYGKGIENPLLYVKFIDKNNKCISIDLKIINSMCPQNFSLEL